MRMNSKLEMKQNKCNKTPEHPPDAPDLSVSEIRGS